MRKSRKSISARDSFTSEGREKMLSPRYNRANGARDVMGFRCFCLFMYILIILLNGNSKISDEVIA